MSYQVLARKYRPQRFSEVIGQDHVTRTLKNAIEQQRIAHGYIFSGHRGIGKTTIARILAMALNCRSTDKPTPEPCGVCESCVEIKSGSAVDVIEIDAATNRGIDEIRELRDAARYRPARDRYKVYILDEAHQITDPAFNALLKTLEEPPSHIVFMLATTQPEDIPQTIRSRCQNFSFHAVKFEEIVGQLGEIAAKENVQAEDAALAVLAEAGDGSMRDALSIMDQAIAGCGNRLTAEQVRGLLGSVGPEILEELMGTVSRNAADEALRLVDRQVMEGQNPAHLARQLVRLLRNVLVAKVAGDDSSLLQISADERARAGRIAQQFSEEDLARFLQIMLRTFDELGYRQEQRFHLELGILKLVHAQRLLPLEQILTQVSGGTPKGSVTQMPRSTSETAVSKIDTAKSQPRVSPFDADRVRKNRGFDPEMSGDGRSASFSATNEATAGAAAAVGVAVASPTGGDEQQKIVTSVLANLAQEPGNDNLVATLEGGSVELTESELIIRIDKPSSVIPFIMSADQRKAASIAASAAAGRPLKLILAGGVSSAVNGTKPVIEPVRNGFSARSRAVEDPVVRRMQEKFGAEIRTVIDHREKR